MIYDKLVGLQNELKAPKGQYNSFGNYKYRSCEDIMESVKPLLAKYGLALVVSDNLELIGNRFYVKAIARVYDIKDGTFVEATAYAREAEAKKGMDESQITGATSSYARKYALNGLFAIDDTKDADALNDGKNMDSSKSVKKAVKEEKPFTVNLDEEEAPKLTNGDVMFLAQLTEKWKVWFCKKYNVSDLRYLTKQQVDEAQKIYNKALENQRLKEEGKQ